MSPNLSSNMDDDTNQDTSDYDSENPWESTLLSNIEENDLDHQQDVPLLG